MRRVCLFNGTPLIEESGLLYSNGEPASILSFQRFILEVILQNGMSRPGVPLSRHKDGIRAVNNEKG